jgi:hypothetical protein
MATYKLIQDVEAEDKILGPLTLRQFIFALISALLSYMCFFVVVKHAAFLLIALVPPTLLGWFFAFPFGKDQPTEIWALAKIRFWFKPRKRIWDQSGVKELVSITAPKKVERVYTDGLSQTEVKSRLSALANTIDSRGWAVKNVNLNTYSAPNPLVHASSDRLIDIGSIPQVVPEESVAASDDMLDEQNNPIAQQFDSMITQSAQTHRQQLVAQMNTVGATQTAATVTSDPWFLGGSGPATVADETRDDEALLAKSKSQMDAREVSYGHMKTLQPLGSQPAAPTQNNNGNQPAPAMTPQPDPAILSLASNNDLSVTALAHEARKAKRDEPDKGEVVISLR